MVPKNGTQLPSSQQILSDSALAAQIGAALRRELGSSRRATKSLMRWSEVSDKTARNWLHGKVSPSGRHLICLAKNSPMVMTALLDLTGHPELQLGLKLHEIELGMSQALAQVRSMTHQDQNDPLSGAKD